MWPFKKKITYRVQVFCNSCMIGYATNDRFHVVVPKGKSAVGRKVKCPNCGRSDNVRESMNKSGINAYYIN